MLSPHQLICSVFTVSAYQLEVHLYSGCMWFDCRRDVYIAAGLGVADPEGLVHSRYLEGESTRLNSDFGKYMDLKRLPPAGGKH